MSVFIVALAVTSKIEMWRRRNWVVCDSTVFGTSIVKRGELSSTPTPTYCGGLQQLGSKKRKKLSLLDGNLEIPSSRSKVE